MASQAARPRRQTEAGAAGDQWRRWRGAGRLRSSGYYGVIPSGKRWQARLYKPVKKGWDPVGTYDTPREAAEAAAKAKKRLEDGLPVHSPLFKRFRKSEGVRLAQRAPRLAVASMRK